MHIMYYQTIVLTVLIACFALAASHFESSENPKLLFISFDAFRWDYLDRVGRTRAPNFFRLIDNGAKPEFVTDAYVTRTFPNHWTMVTGLYEESHGMVDNKFFDPKLNETFVHTSKQMSESKWWDIGIGALPLWTANELAGNGRKSGSVYFPGSLVHIKNILPYQSLGPYNATMPKPAIIDTTMDWFMDKHNPINFGAIYIDEPDRLTHGTGPDDPKVDELIMKLDTEVIGKIFTRLNKSEDMEHDLNIIVTGDHGMTEVSKNRVVLTNDYIHPSLYSFVAPYAPIWHVTPSPGKEEEVYQKFKTIPELNTWKRAEIPARFHYSKSERIGDILVVAKKGWLMAQDAAEAAKWTSDVFGIHGYDNSLPDMHPFFIAYGPAFKKGYKRGPINIVDIYPLACHVLGVKGGVNNGSLDHVRDMLVPPEHHDMTTTFVTFLLVVICASLVTGIYTIAFICQRRRQRPIVRRVRLLDQRNGLDLSSNKPMLGLSDDELDL